LGFSIVDLGIASSTMGVGLILFEPLWGVFTPRLGTKKIFVLAILGTLLINFSYTFVTNLTGFMILRFVSGVLMSGWGVSSRTLVRKIISKGGRAFGSWFAIGSISGLIGPVVGGYLASSNYILVFYTATIVGLIALILALGISEPTLKNDVRKEEVNGIRKREKNTLLITALLTIIPFFLSSVFWTFIPVFAKESEKLLLTSIEIGVLFSVMSFVGIAAPLLFGELSDKIGRKKLIIIGMMLQAASFLLLPNIAGLPMLCMTAAILRLGSSAISPSLMALLTDIMRPSKQSLAIGVYGAGEDLGILLSPLIVGYIYHNYTAELSFYFTAGLMIANIGIALPLLSHIEETKLSKNEPP
jgi:DHA1 family multidrug resistance protein-like MFS transporter